MSFDQPVDVEHAVPRRVARPILRRLAHDLTARIGLMLVTGFLLLAAIGPRLAPHDPREVTVGRLQGPSLDHRLGTDGLGRGLFSRLLHGSRLTLGTALLAAVLVTAIGLVVGRCRVRSVGSSTACSCAWSMRCWPYPVWCWPSPWPACSRPAWWR